MRKSNSVGINEISNIGHLAEKLGSWLSEERFGIDIANVRQSSADIGISLGDDNISTSTITKRKEKDALGK